MLDAFTDKASPAEKEHWAGLFRVAEVHPPLRRRVDRDEKSDEGHHVVASSLFWKPANSHEPDFPLLTREVLLNPASHGITTRINHPWEHYVEPLLRGAKRLLDNRPDVIFRVYLARDLSFLLPDLLEAGCEVLVMETSSIAHNPGAMWRFLAMEEENCLVTITDADRAHDVIYDVERTELVAKAGLGHWRVPYTFGAEETRRAAPTHYRPILACQFGSAKSYPMSELMSAFLWHHEKATFPTQVTIGSTAQNIFATRWPDYGFDEWFLLAVMFPRMAFEGVLTFVPWNDHALNQWFALDIEYCTWANPKSEIMYHSDPELAKLPQIEKRLHRKEKAPQTQTTPASIHALD
ncbi:hypothetical protein [Roseibacillus ishigakijimensis]|uniref:Uncharacterized protein n=1 Tax=Roseibacillus ishigakijimensis TaxID=454146 RepID=A0A934RSP8_9BACT|nr:hypothetical protein [Roseibacillus ishigakijimensis]MBK1833520.1 hypothetical protein [Roseibacillus ishigakijimensis]